MALGNDLAFLSGYVTRNGYRKQGIGTQLFQAAVAPLQHRNIFLDSNASRPQLYKSIGFNIEGPIIIDIVAIPDRTYIGKERDDRVKILPHTTVDMAAIEAYDIEIHPVDRRALLHGCLAHSDKAFVAIRDGHLVGYTCISTGPQGYYMGMLYSDNPTVAHMLWDSCLEHTTPDTRVQVWFFMANQKAANLYSCYKMDLGEVDKSIRLSTKAEMWQPSDKVFSAMQYNTLG